MRHRVAGKKLNRDVKHRKALFKNLIKSLIINEEINTSESKAKVIKRILDKLISKGKKGTLHSRRTIAAFLQEKKVVNKLVDDIVPRFKNRISGFTRIIKIGERRGDNSLVVKIELTEKKEKEESQKKNNKAKSAEKAPKKKEEKKPKEKTNK